MQSRTRIYILYKEFMMCNTNYAANIKEPDPVKNEAPGVWGLVISDMMDRDRVGMKKYNTRSQPVNGRDPLWDAYQEALDLCVYLRQAIFEKELR